YFISFEIYSNLMARQLDIISLMTKKFISKLKIHNHFTHIWRFRSDNFFVEFHLLCFSPVRC
ncbi:MAG: hypothetical protein ACXWRE_13820, partial [Pseudobdellovibrionaceae bacterium]